MTGGGGVVDVHEEDNSAVSTYFVGINGGDW